MAATGGDDDSTILLSTPTWAIACTCAIFILISLMIERASHRIGHYAGNYNHAALRRAFEKMKDELLMVGILSLALAMGQSSFAKVCVPAKLYKYGRLCRQPLRDTNKTTSVHDAIHVEQRQLLAATPSTCKEGNVPFMTAGSIHNLHIFVFILAAVHIIYTVMIIAIGMWVVGRWKSWEEKAVEREKKVTTEGAARLTHQTTFIRNRAANKWLRSPPVAFVVCFFKQFFRRVTETDYITLRAGFIKKHFGDNRAFNFHKFIQRSFQEDFKHVVWHKVTFPVHNCLYGSPMSLVRRIVIGVVSQLVCGLVALPAYALVSQMGSRLKKTIFHEVVNIAVMNWQAKAKRNAGNAKNSSNPSVKLFASPNLDEDSSVPPHHELEIYAHEQESGKASI